MEHRLRTNRLHHAGAVANRDKARHEHDIQMADERAGLLVAVVNESWDDDLE